MKGRRQVRSGTIVFVGLVLLVLGALAGGIAGHFSASPSVNASGTEHLYLTIAFDPYTGLDKYFPANFTIPANVPVLITITNYDNGTNVVPAAFAKVTGTVDGTETITNATASGVAVTSIPATRVTHTFTLVAAPYNINAPIPAAQGTHPTVVSFTVVLTTPGQYTWHCMAPCDMDAMMTPGFMMGTVTVVNE
ncbi:MAG TPA: hypothetical protein VEY12_00010 [Thermoplasmata archaeon]|nr:hypothetical protein [Thermoplasmata archaeon]